MRTEIGTGVFKAVIDSLGAELKSLHDGQREYLWGGDSAWWSGTAPVLFPNIGGFHTGKYRYRGKTYSIGSHGFARNALFTLKDHGPDYAVFELISNEQLHKCYPFKFQLLVSFFTDYAGITVEYTVRNIGSPRMFFSIGSHPAFCIPFDGGVLEHYYVEFEQPEDAQRYFFIDGCISDHSEPVLSNSRQIFLTRKLFDRGPLIFKGLNSRTVLLRKSRSMKHIAVHADAPYLAIWSKPNGAPFACIEPWHGIPDPVGFTGTFGEKPGIICLEYRETFSTGYSIEIN